MEYLHEGLFLGIDLLILGACTKEYLNFKQYISNLKSAPQLPIDADLKNILASQGNKIPYCFVRGSVTPMGVPLRSVLSPTVTGVLQVVKLREHRVARGVIGLWTEQKRLIHVSTNEMPFELRSKDFAVEVIDALNAQVLDMDVVYDVYEPATLSIFDHICGFFSGVRQKGLQKTEEILRDGSILTGVGELELDGDSIRLQPSSSGPLILTTATKANLIKKFESMKSSALCRVIICGSIAAVLIALITRKLLKKRRLAQEERKVKDKLERERRLRRAVTRPRNLNPDQICVVCHENPKEIILLPCGHVCICEDCSQEIRVHCPICRSKIESKSAAFIA